MRVGSFLIGILFFASFLLVFGVLLSSPVYGASFSVEKGEFDNTLENNLDFAFVDIVVTNFGGPSIFNFDFGEGFFSSFWDVSSDSPSVFNEGLYLESDESRTIRVKIRPHESTVLREGFTYKVPFIVSSSGKSSSFDFFIKVDKDPVTFYFDSSNLVDFRNPVDSSKSSFTVFVNLKSKVSVDLSEVSVFVSGGGFNLSDSVSVSSLGFESLNFNVPTSDFSLGKNTLRFDFVVDDKSLSPFFKEVDFGGVGFSIVESEPSSFLLRTFNRVSFNNFGESVKSVSYEVPVSSNPFVEFFSFESPDSFEIVERGGEEFKVWSFDVPIGEVREITFGSDYRLFIYFAFFVVSVGVIYFFFRSSLSVGKKVVIISRSKSSYRFKIVISVKNRSNKILSNASIMDFLPKFVSFDKRVISGFGKPNSISVTKSGTVLKWKVSSIGPGEEQFFSYFGSSTDVNVVGSIDFSSCKVIFYDDSRSKFASKSRRIKVSLN